MTTAITVLAPIKLAANKTEADLLAASDTFEKEFVSKEAGVIRRELVRKGDNEYMEAVMEKEKTSTICHAFFSVMDLENSDDSQMLICPSIATYS